MTRILRAALASVAIVATLAACDVTEYRPVPSCTEDAVIVRAEGSTFHDGRWSAYACGPAADDYVEAVR